MPINVDIEFFSVDEKLPEIPKGKYGVPVLVLTKDKYETVIREVLYTSTTDRKGRKSTPYKDSPLDFDFQELCEGYYKDTDWVPMFSPVKYWAYLPDIGLFNVN